MGLNLSGRDQRSQRKGGAKKSDSIYGKTNLVFHG
jgi:hypothetical protein